MLPVSIGFMPVQWGSDIVFVNPHPAFIQPEIEISIPSCFYKFKKVSVGYQCF
jgi:hypothetical protein